MLTLNYSLRSLYLGTGDRIILSFFWAGVTSCSGASSGTSEYICFAMGHLSLWKLEENVYSDYWSSGQGLPHYTVQPGSMANATPTTDDSQHL